MGRKKPKPGRRPRRKSRSEGVKASTSLPPSVDGQLRCYLRVTVSKIEWDTKKIPDVFFLRLKWWGELTDGSLFRPWDGKQETKSEVRKTARYPIRCGPKQFAEYLNAMSTCVFELLRGDQMASIGRATVCELGILSPQNPVSGTYPIFSNLKAEKLANIAVSMRFEPLPVSYDSSSSVPTTDISLPAPSKAHSGHSTDASTTSQRSILKKQTSRAPPVASLPITSTTGGNKDSRHTPSGVDDDYSFVIGPGAGGMRNPGEKIRPQRSADLQNLGRGVLETAPVSDSGTDTLLIPRSNPPPMSRFRYEVQPASEVGGHLISTILDKGNRLMDSMIRAQCVAQPKASEDHKSDRLSGAEPHHLRRSSSGELFRELLKDEEAGHDRPQTFTYAAGKDSVNLPLELVVGDGVTGEELKALKTVMGTSPVESDISEEFNGIDTNSDDPLHEDSILEELFYKGQRTSSDSEGMSDLLLSSSDSESPGSGRRHCSKGNLKERRNGSRAKSVRSEVVQVGEDMDPDKSSLIRSEDAKKSQGRDDVDDLKDSATSDGDTSSTIGTLLQMSSTGVEGLSVQRLTLLGRVHAAKVAIDTLTLSRPDPAVSARSRIPQRITSRDRVSGKPPRPQVKSTYFVEYQFPVTASSEDNMATEVMRVVSKKVTDKEGRCEIQFGHRSVFPVQFDGSTVDHWWTRLLVLRIYHKVAGQKTPSLIAVASTPLRSILSSPDFAVTLDLPVESKEAARRLSLSTSSLTTDTTDVSLQVEEKSQLGEIKVSIQLTSDSGDFPAALARMKVAELKGAKIIPLPTSQRTYPPNHRRQSDKRRPRERSRSSERFITEPREVRRMEMTFDPKTDHVNYEAEVNMPQGESNQEHLTLHTLLMIPDARGITVQGMKPLTTHSINQSGISCNTHSVHQGRDLVTRNPYLNCKMFWSDDAVHSHVCWGTTEPQFAFSQVAPVLLTPSLLERTRNNFMVVEVWDKKTSGQNDVLVGIAKLPLHQFYMSFRDQKIAEAILKSQYPVVGIDNYAPIVNPFSGVHYGQIKVLLAMGASHQISALQRLKGDIINNIPKPERPHYLERSQKPAEAEKSHTELDQRENILVEHTFEVVIEGVRSLPQGDDSVWGEADCFVQYHFPSQESQYNQLQGSLTLRSFRTATALCLPDPAFNEVTRHRISLPHDVPVQRELLSACVGVGGAAGCIPLELWCRYYYPNVRDQVIAKAFLPLAKLCAMVTMQHRGEPSIQTFNLPLKAHQQGDDKTQVSSGGFLDVTVSYRQSAQKINPVDPSVSTLSSFPQVTLTVAILRATGLQAAAVSLARYHPSLQYSCEVGINTFVTVQLSFLPKEESKRSRTVARSFAPELSHHIDFSCPLTLQVKGHRSDQRETSLAEILETADAVVRVWHQVQQSNRDDSVDLLYPSEDGALAGRQLVAPPKEILLGTTTVPLRHLLLKTTGLNGWFTVVTSPPSGWDAPTPTDHPPHSSNDASTPVELRPAPQDERNGGGLELVVRFARKTDRQKVIQVGERMGWTPSVNVEDDETTECLSLPVTIAVQFDRVTFHEHSILRAGQTHIGDNCHAYVRYQFYDKRPTCSDMVSVRLSHDGQLSADVNLNQHVELTMNPSLTWYLREEHLVVQVWISQDGKKNDLPKKSDRQIGSAHIDMTSLIIEGGRHRRISGLYALTKPGVNNMHGACLRGAITLNVGQQQQAPEIDSEGKDIASDEEEEARVEEEHERMVKTITPPPEIPKVVTPAPFELHIERAMGLCTSPQRWSTKPLSTYVTLAIGDGDPIMTSTVPDTPRPVWNYYQEILLDPQDVVEKQHLIFKVWHQTTSRQDMSCDRMLGFTSVDLGPLLVGFRSLNGWYNIVDFSSQVKGQMKIAITPKRDLSELKQQAIQFMRQSAAMPGLPPPHLHSWQNGTSSGSHYREHKRGVRETHERMRQQTHPREGDEGDPSLSRLKENLRKNLADLDSLREHLDRKRLGFDGQGAGTLLDGRTGYANEADRETSAAGRIPNNGSEKSSQTGVHEVVRSGRICPGMPDSSEDAVRNLDTPGDVQYDRMSLSREADDRGNSLPSRSPEESLSESEADFIVPRTLNEVITNLDSEGNVVNGEGFRELGGDVWDAKRHGEREAEGRNKDDPANIPLWGVEPGASVLPSPSNRTCTDVLEDMSGSQEGGQGEEEEGESVMNSIETGNGYETPEEALVRIQQRLTQVVGHQIIAATAGGIPSNEADATNLDRDEVNGQPSEMFHHTVTLLREREANPNVTSVPEHDQECSSISLESLSEHEELASFASSRDEGESPEMPNILRQEKSKMPSPINDIHLEIQDDGELGDNGSDKPCESEGLGLREDDSPKMCRPENQNGRSKGTRGFPNGGDGGQPESDQSQQEPRLIHQEGKPPKDSAAALLLPNFFLPREDLATAMRTLDTAVSGPPAPTNKHPEVGSLSERIQAARKITRRMEEGARAERIPSQPARPRRYPTAQPTAEEAKRIARIFSTKYSPP